MACVNADGTLTTSAKLVLGALQAVSTPEEVSQNTRLPLFRVRASMRELVEAGLVLMSDGSYRLSGEGQARITAG